MLSGLFGNRFSPPENPNITIQPGGFNMEGVAASRNPVSLINDLDKDMGMYGERVNGSLYDRFKNPNYQYGFGYQQQ